MSVEIENDTFNPIYYLSCFPITDYDKGKEVLSLAAKAYLLEVFDNPKLQSLNNLVLLIPDAYHFNTVYIYNNEYMLLTEVKLPSDKIDELIDIINGRKDMHASLIIAGELMYGNDEVPYTTIYNYVYRELIIADQRSLEEAMRCKDYTELTYYEHMTQWYNSVKLLYKSKYLYKRYDETNMSDMLNRIIRDMTGYQKALSAICGDTSYEKISFFKKLWFKFLSFF